MGSVAVDIHKKERLYEQLTLSDKNVVKYLLLYRNKIDIGYGVNVNIDINQAGDIFDFNQELIALYVSLDELIEKINFKDKDKEFLKLIFDGNSVSDIIKNYNFPKMTAYRTLNRIVNLIVKVNNEDWQRVMKNNGYIT